MAEHGREQRSQEGQGMQRICQVCKKPLNTTHKNARYCAECRPVMQRYWQREWMRKNKHRLPDNSKPRNWADLKHRKCLLCGLDFWSQGPQNRRCNPCETQIRNLSHIERNLKY